MHPLFPSILLTVVLSWVLVTLWTRVLDGAVVAIGMKPDRLPDAFLVAVVCTTALVAAISGLGQAGVGLADSVAGMELSALRTPNPAVEQAWMGGTSPTTLHEVRARLKPASPARRRRDAR